MSKQFEHILVEYGPLLSRVAATYEANESLRQELYQDICMAVWQALQAFKGESSIKTYLLRVAHNRCVTHVSKAVNSVNTQSFDEQNDQASNNDNDALSPSINTSSNTYNNSVEQSLIQSMQVEALLSAVRKLKLPARQVVTLSLEGLSYQEIAEVTGLSSSNVGAIINRSKKELQRQMQNDF